MNNETYSAENTEAVKNILMGIKDKDQPSNRSELGQIAFPNETFHSPAGASFLVSRIVDDMLSQGLIYSFRGYRISRKGVEYIYSPDS